MTTTQLLMMILAFVICLAVGAFCVARPSAVQQYVLQLYEHRERAQRLNPLWKWMQGPTYVLSIRLVGGVAMLMALVLLFALVFRLKE
jgi:hypothetical protein